MQYSHLDSHPNLQSNIREYSLQKFQVLQVVPETLTIKDVPEGQLQKL